MKNIKPIILTLALATAGICASAQSRSSYFLDNYVYGYRLNPAIMSERSFFSLPVVGNVQADIQSGIGVSTLLYPAPDRNGLVTGFNSSVSSEEFLSKIKDANAIGLTADFNFISLGFRKERSMTNIELNFRTTTDAALPGDLFRLLKEGSKASAYDLSNTKINVRSYLELAFGKSHMNVEHTFTFGYRVKLLAGLAGADVLMNDTQATVNGEQLSVNVNANGRIACPFISFETKEDGTLGNANFDPTKLSPAGFGGAIDAGVVWTPNEHLSVSAAINDLGAISWTYNTLLESKGSVEFNGLDLSAENSDAQAELDKVADDFKKLANFGIVDGTASQVEMLPFTANLGARFRIPYAEFIGLGVHGSYRNGITPEWDARAALTLSPCGWFSITGNYGYGTFGPVCGAALSLTILGLNLFASVDGYCGPLGLYESIPYPVNDFRYRANVGLVMQIGKRFTR